MNKTIRGERAKLRRAVARLADYLDGCLRVWDRPIIVDPFDGKIKRATPPETIFHEHVLKLADRIARSNEWLAKNPILIQRHRERCKRIDKLRQKMERKAQSK
jgi:hypothetical protein